MVRTPWKTILADIAWEAAGSFLIAVGLYNFALEAAFPMTGFSGVALILYRLWGLPVGLTTIALNIPAAVLSARLVGRDFLLRSMRCMVISSGMIDLLAPLLPVYTGPRILAALACGALSGLGYALIYMRGSSTGGLDLIIMAVKRLAPHLKLGSITFFADLAVILCGGLIFLDVDGLICGVLVSFLMSVTLDRVLLGLSAGKVGLVVTSRGKEICALIDGAVRRGSTILSAQGGWRQDEKQVVMVACTPREMYRIRQTVEAFDPEAFLIILDANEVRGEGFCTG